jgi:hypothetical protein
MTTFNRQLIRHWTPRPFTDELRPITTLTVELFITVRHPLVPPRSVASATNPAKALWYSGNREANVFMSERFFCSISRESFQGDTS